MVVRMRHTRAHSGNRRSHHGIEEPRLATCKDCGASHVRHSMCNNCGRYRGRVVVDVAAKEARRAKRLLAKKAERGEEVSKEEKDAVAGEKK